MVSAMIPPRKVTDAVLLIQREGQDIDLHMVEIMTMEHRSSKESRLVKGLVLDHGGRHPDMPKKVNNAYIMTCNVGLEYEKSEVNAVSTLCACVGNFIVELVCSRACYRD